MVAWNLSVSLTGNSDNLVRTLRRSTNQARNLSRELADARRNLDALGSGSLTTLTREIRSASSDVSDLRRELAELRREAASDIHIGLRVDAATLRTDVQAAVGAAGTGQGLAVGLRLADAQQLRRDVQTAVRWAAWGHRIEVPIGLRGNGGNLRAEVQAALGGADPDRGLAVGLRLADAQQLRRDVQNAVRWASWGHRIDIPIGLADPMQLRRDVSAAVRWAQTDQTITVRVRADTSGLGELPRTIGGGGGGDAGGGLQGLMLLAPAVIPLATALAPLPGIFAASGAAATAFGIAVAGQLTAISEVSDAATKYQDAVRQHGATSQKAAEAQAEYQSQLAQLPPEAQRAAMALAELKDNYQQWSDSLSGSTMQPVVHSLALMDALLPHLTPEVKSASRELDRLITLAGGAVNTPGFDAASDRFADFTDQTLDRMGDRLVHVLRLMSGGEVNGPLAQVMDYIRANGDEARETLSNLGDAVGNLFEGAAEAGPTMLTLVNAAAKLVAALPPELVGTIIQVAAALKLVQLAGAGIAAVAGGLATVQARIAALHATSVAAGGGLAGLRAAFLSLGTAARASVIVAGIGLAAAAIHELMEMGKEAPPDIDRLTTSLGKLGQSGKVTGELSKNFGQDLDDLYDKIRNITDPSTADNVQNALVKIFSLTLMDSTPWQEARENLDAIDEGLANLVKGGKADQAAAAYERLKEAYAKGGHDVGEFTGQMDQYKSAVEDLEFEQSLAAASMGIFGKAAQDTQARLDAQKASADGLRQSIVALNDVNRKAGSAMSAFEASIDDVAKAAKEHHNVLKMRDGQLDLGNDKAREAEKTLSELAANTDAATTAAREQGRSWEDVTGIYEKGRKTFIDAADTMGLTREQAEALADSYLQIPDEKTTRLEMRNEDALAGLNAVIEQIEATPDAKSVKVDALTKDAVTVLESLGFEVTRLPDGQFEVTAETGTAKDRLEGLKATRDGLQNKTITIDANSANAVQDLDAVIAKIRATPGAKSVTVKTLSQTAIQALNAVGFTTRTLPDGRVVVTAATGTALSNIGAVQGARDALSDKSITITTRHVSIYETVHTQTQTTADLIEQQARNFGAQADGGIVDFYADGGLRRENHIAQIARGGDWRIWAEDETHGEAYVPFARSKRPRSRRITEEVVRRLGGDPSGIAWNADGGITRYADGGMSFSYSSSGTAANKYTLSGLINASNDKKGNFSLSIFTKKLAQSNNALAAWRKNLDTVARRAGQDVADALAEMGDEGIELTRQMATGSSKYLKQMSKELQNLANAAKASLPEYTSQLTDAVKDQTAFQKNLATLAARGYGDLAARLAEQNDQDAADLAAAAVKDNKKAAAANSAAKKANTTLSSDQVEDLVQIISAVTSSKVGIHDVAEKTGLSEEDIIDIANLAKAQIQSALGSRATKFLADLGRANKGLSFADGGIREGIYSTNAGLVRFAEPSTGGEAYIPLGLGRRDRATAVLDDVAGRFGYTLTGAQDAQSSRVRVIVIRQPAALIGSMPVTMAAAPGATPEQFGAEVMRRLRNAQRGGRA
ncbi:hypothetical protein ACFUIW_33320 [Streptomyces sp. NPDC057245]|uniref:hypothetical protein n=1 Tax=Streptomyces sp. NPDC057245 TaxID=3346065 RepID=UPI0036290718